MCARAYAVRVSMGRLDNTHTHVPHTPFACTRIHIDTHAHKLIITNTGVRLLRDACAPSNTTPRRPIVTSSDEKLKLLALLLESVALTPNPDPVLVVISVLDDALGPWTNPLFNDITEFYHHDVVMALCMACASAGIAGGP